MNDPPIWAEIDIGAIAHNIREVKRVTRPKIHMMAVVKANAYGHGAVPVSRVALENGADFLGVARIQEGIELRQAGIGAPILVFGYASPEETRNLVEFELKQTVYSVDMAKSLSEAASAMGKTIDVHLKIDTGMGRLGYTVETKTNPVEALELIQSKPGKFDLIITDMTMPQMTGVKLSKK